MTAVDKVEKQDGIRMQAPIERPEACVSTDADRTG